MTEAERVITPKNLVAVDLLNHQPLSLVPIIAVILEIALLPVTSAHLVLSTAPLTVVGNVLVIGVTIELLIDRPKTHATLLQLPAP